MTLQPVPILLHLCLKWLSKGTKPKNNIAYIVFVTCKGFIWECESARMQIETKVVYNKKNGQLHISLPKKSMPFLKDTPKSMTFHVSKSSFKW